MGERTIITALLTLVIVCEACGGGTARTRNEASTPAAARAAPRDEDIPESDRGLATFARTDPPPFPVTDFTRVAGPLEQSLPADRLAAIAAFIRWYERDPYDHAANQWGQGLSTRAALLMWVVGSPDVHVTASPFLAHIAEQRGESADRLGGYETVGGMLGMAAHAIERPGLAPTDDERQAAGLESALRWYEAATRRGAARSALMDELMGVRDRGELAAWIAARVRFGTATQ
ncbi:MAG: hypothetical protein J0L92_35540 [Deltaproteobacteria bacterium]|nr:hypothetical protein [Deltaproteobacteria bacterium]